MRLDKIYSILDGLMFVITIRIITTTFEWNDIINFINFYNNIINLKIL